MSKKILVNGLSALTDGHVVLYHRLSELGYSPVISYRTSDRSFDGDYKVNIVKFNSFRLLELIQFFRFIVLNRPDVVEFYLHEFGGLRPIYEIIKIILCKILQVPITVVCTGREILNYKDNGRLKCFAVRMALYFSPKFLIKESYMKDIIREYHIADENKALFIHNGVYEGLTKCRFGGFKDQKIVLFYNSFKKWRNVPFLVDAAKLILSHRRDVVFLIVGARNNSEVKQVEDRVFDLDSELKWRIQVHEMNSNKEFYFGLADALVLPADIIWLNNTVLEAMLLEVPVVLPNVDWVDKIVTDKVDGFVYSHMDLNEFARKIEQAIDSSEEDLKRITANAKDNVISKFGSEKRAILHHLFYQVYFDKDEGQYSQLFSSDDYQVKSLNEVKNSIFNLGG
ncbi:MAG: glycosyltransferase family 4 protein [Hahellaceae bacterium]|nr:glycosyltransferase family 4 protein [Hahellaceae bacterium]